MRDNVQYVNEISQLESQLDAIKHETQDEIVADESEEGGNVDVDRFLKDYQVDVNGKGDYLNILQLGEWKM